MSAWPRSVATNGWLRLSTSTASSTRAPRRAIRRLPPARPAGCTKHAHWLPQLIVKADKYNKAAVDFLEGHILDHVVNGRIHAEIHPHRSDEGGTRSLRFSYSNPPLQQMPARDEEIAPLIRGVFLPEEGEVWAKPDISQQEFRFIVHYAAKLQLRRAHEAAERYRSDPGTDFHEFAAEMTGLDRQAAKTVNFAKVYGAGVHKFAAMIGKPESEARAIFKQYDRTLPFVHQLSKRCRMKRRTAAISSSMTVRAATGMIGRRPALRGGRAPARAHARRPSAESRIRTPLVPRRTAAPRRHPQGMNALIQGTAARHTKLWMRACWREGIVPLLQMHDSLDCSVASPEQAERVAQLGRDAVGLEVPIQVDLKFGRNWGDAKHSWEELHSTSAIVVPPPQAAAAPSPANPIRIKPDADGKIYCPFHDDSTPSLHVYADHWHCYGCGAHGDFVDWLMMVGGLDRDAAVDTLKRCNGSIAAHIARPNNNEDAGRTLASALRIWEAAVPIAGTPAVCYLAEVRGIDVDSMPDAALRFHPHCPFGAGAMRALPARAVARRRRPTRRSASTASH